MMPFAEPPEEPEPWQGATCGDCQYCYEVDGGAGHCCVFDVIDEPLGLGVLVRVELGDEACESIKRK